VRAVLEGLAGRLFVENATEAERKSLVKTFRRIEQLAQKGSSILAAKDAFYDILFRGGRNDALRGVVGGLHARVSVLRSASLSVVGRSGDSTEELRAIVDAVEANDAEAAARACTFHVEQAGIVGLQALQELDAVGAAD
jgi:DNA-binding GntR family transcriptional regulator